MATTRLIPGYGDVVETDSTARLLPGYGDLVETEAAGGGASVSLTGATATGQIGSLSITGGASVSTTGVSATGQVGSVIVSTGTNVSVDVTGVSATGFLGSVGITGGASVSLSGATATGQVGSVSITGEAQIILSGVEGTGEVGTATAEGTSAAPGSTSVAPTGVSATALLGLVTVTGGATVALTGVQGVGGVGSIVFAETVVSTVSPGSKPKQQARFVFTVKYDGKDYHFLTMDDALAFLKAHQEEIKVELEAQAERAATRILKAGKRARKVFKPKTLDVKGPVELISPIRDEIRRIERHFDNTLSEILMAEAELKDVMDIVRML